MKNFSSVSTSPRRLAALLVSVGTLAAVGCGDSGSSGSGGGGTGGDAGTGGSTTTTSTTSSGGGGGGGPTLVNGCDISTAEDMTGMAAVDLTWSNPHQKCIRISAGTDVTWTGTFSVHPLSGGVTGTPDALSPITAADQTGAAATVNFEGTGEFPYYCTVHLAAMQGVIYVE
jgi:plastocyanin